MQMGTSFTANRLRTLVADDQPDVCTALHLLLKAEGFEIDTVGSPDAVLNAVATQDYDLVLMDLNYTRDTTSGLEGLSLINGLRALDANLPVVAMTAWGSLELAVAALREGVTDFILKPWDNDQLVATLRKHQANHRQAQSRKLAQDRELTDAHSLQQSLLPKRLPVSADYELSAVWKPAKAIGGDFYDVWQVDDDHLAFCIGDVMGKGTPAALLMAHLQSAAKAHVANSSTPADLCTRLNQLIHGVTEGARFVTFFFAVFDQRTKQLTYTNAGHNSPLLMNAKNESQLLSTGGVPLGAFANSNYRQGVVQLASGDRLLLFTDGVTECCNETGEEFGEDRLRNLMRDLPGSGARALCDGLAEAIQVFNSSDFQDDATWLAFTLR